MAMDMGKTRKVMTGIDEELVISTCHSRLSMRLACWGGHLIRSPMSHRGHCFLGACAAAKHT